MMTIINSQREVWGLLKETVWWEIFILVSISKINQIKIN